MKWIHVAGVLRLSCKNMPQEMRVREPMESKRGGRFQEQPEWLGATSAEGLCATANKKSNSQYMFG